MNTSPSHHVYKRPVLVWHPESGHARHTYVWFTSVGCVYGSGCTWTGGEGGEVGGHIGRSDVKAWYSRYNIWDLECTLSYDQDLLVRVIQSCTLRWRVHGTFLLSRKNERCPYRILLKLHTFYFWLVSWIITVWTTEDGIERRQILPPSISETRESMWLSAWNNIAIMLGLTV